MSGLNYDFIKKKQKKLNINTKKMGVDIDKNPLQTIPKDILEDRNKG